MFVCQTVVLVNLNIQAFKDNLENNFGGFLQSEGATAEIIYLHGTKRGAWTLPRIHCIRIRRNILYVLLVREMQLYIKDVRVVVGNGFVVSL